MKSKKSVPEATKSTPQKIDEGAQVPGIQAVIKPDQEQGAPIPSIQPVVNPDVNPQPAPDVQPTPSTQPETAPEPGSSEPESSK